MEGRMNGQREGRKEERGGLVGGTACMEVIRAVIERERERMRHGGK